MPLTILDHIASEAVALQSGYMKTLLAGTEIHAAVRENFEDHPDGGHRCKLCGERVGHPRAAAAHLAVKHWHALRKPAKGDRISAGGPGSGRHPSFGAMQKAGFKETGSRRVGVRTFTANLKTLPSKFDEHVTNYHHRIDVKDNGSWRHTKGPVNTNMSIGRVHGKNLDQLHEHLTSGKFQKSFRNEGWKAGFGKWDNVPEAR